MLGLVHSMIQMTLTVQAAESTTKKVRRWLLVCVAYVSAVSSLTSTLLFFVYDDRPTVTYNEESFALSIISYILMGLSLLAQLANCFTSESMAYLLGRGLEAKAFQQMIRLKSKHLSRFEIRYEYERIKLEAVQDQLDGKQSLFARINRRPLTRMSYIRIMAVLVSNIPMTLALIYPMHGNGDTLNGFNKTTAAENSTVDSTESIDDRTVEEIVPPLSTLATVHVLRLLISVLCLKKSEKHHFSRFFYKISYLYGATSVSWFAIRTLFSTNSIVRWVFLILVLTTMVMTFFVLPIPLDILQLSQTADSYARIKNTRSLALLVLIENLVHMVLIAHMNVVFGPIFSFLIHGTALMYFSKWLLKNMPNVIAVCPIAFEVSNSGEQPECDYI